MRKNATTLFHPMNFEMLFQKSVQIHLTYLKDSFIFYVEDGNVRLKYEI